MEPQSFARRRCPMCSSSNPLTAPCCDVCGYGFDQAEMQIVMPSGGTLYRNTLATEAVLTPSAMPRPAARFSDRSAAKQTVQQPTQTVVRPSPAGQTLRQAVRPAPTPVSNTGRIRSASASGAGSPAVTVQRTAARPVSTRPGAAKPAMTQAEKAANLARLLSSTNTTAASAAGGAASTTARVSPHTQASQLGVWMLISLLILVGAVLATAAIFMNSTVRP